MSTLVETFSALADPTRLSMVERLMRDGALPAGELSAGYDISAPAISRHLKVLRAAGLVSQEVRGTQRIYSVRPEALRGISDWTQSHRAFWSAALDRLEETVLLEGHPDD
jgi:DNA-binding transcriptional ArsR family regulator